MPIYREVKDENGQVTYEPIENEEDFIKETSVYRDVLGEAIENRKKKALYRQRIEELEKLLKVEEPAKPDAPSSEPAENQAPAQQPFVDPDVLAQQIEAKLLKSIAEKEEAARQAKKRIDDLLQTHGLPEKLRPVVEQSTDPEGTAKALAGAALSFTDTAPSTERDAELDEFNKRVLERMFKSK